MVSKNIDLKIWENNCVTLYAQQGETDSRYIKVSFKDQELKNLDLTGKTVTIYAKKPDNTQIFNTCTINTNDNTVTAKLTSQFLSSKGIVECEFQIFEGSTVLLKVNGLKIIVFSMTNFADAIESTSEYNTLLESIEKAQTFANNTGDIANLNTTNKDSLVAAINELVGNTGNISNINTTNKDSLVAAINELVGNTGNISNINTTNKNSLVEAVNELLNNMGNITSINTTDKSSIISAINELVTNTGNISNLNTANKNSLVNAVNELNVKTIPISQGGTGATNSISARTNLEVMKAHILYNNDEGNSGTITLNDNADNYEFLDIIIWDFYGNTRVYNRNNRPVGLMKTGGYGGNLIEWNSESITISGNTITRNGCTHATLREDNSLEFNYSNHIPIRTVIGYKY